jgi:hypothetical protein
MIAATASGRVPNNQGQKDEQYWLQDLHDFACTVAGPTARTARPVLLDNSASPAITVCSGLISISTYGTNYYSAFP